jgi:hypothetical protein
MMTARRVAIIDFVSQGHIDGVRDLIKQNCNVDETDYCGDCAVIRCVERNDFNILTVLIDEGKANVDVVDAMGCSALLLAQQLEHHKIAQLLEETLRQRRAPESTVQVTSKPSETTESSKDASSSNLRANGFDGLHFHGKHYEELKSLDNQDELKEMSTGPKNE